MNESVVKLSTTGLWLVTLLHIAAGAWLFLIVWGISQGYKWWQKALIAVGTWFMAVPIIQCIIYSLLRIDTYLIFPDWMIWIPTVAYVISWIIYIFVTIRRRKKQAGAHPGETTLRKQSAGD